VNDENKFKKKLMMSKEKGMLKNAYAMRCGWKGIYL
jgi:hypothetical protein